MAKRDGPREGSSKSPAMPIGAKSDKGSAKSTQKLRERLATRGASPDVGKPADATSKGETPPIDEVSRRDDAAAPAPHLGVGRRVRTPPPSTAGRPDRAGAPEQRGGMAARRPTRNPASIDPPRPQAPSQELGAGRRLRTPPPRLVPGEVEEINLGGGRPRQGQPRQQGLQGRPGRRGRGIDRQGQVQGRGGRQGRAGGQSPRARLEAKAAQFRDIQDFLHNPSLFDLRKKPLDTSSTLEEIDERKGEVRYQIQVMRSLLAVLMEELSELDRAKPKEIAEKEAAEKTESAEPRVLT
jgi:hypothetical protein